MQLRKTLGHPYLYDPEIEPSDVTDSQVQESLVEGSAKLVFLRKFMPKLLARGHRMLIFSQCQLSLACMNHFCDDISSYTTVGSFDVLIFFLVTMFLDVMERFLDGEKIEYLRLVCPTTLIFSLSIMFGVFISLKLGFFFVLGR
jgi:SNF2 family DNA or RNA helicase